MPTPTPPVFGWVVGNANDYERDHGRGPSLVHLKRKLWRRLREELAELVRRDQLVVDYSGDTKTVVMRLSSGPLTVREWASDDIIDGEMVEEGGTMCVDLTTFYEPIPLGKTLVEVFAGETGREFAHRFQMEQDK